MQHCKIPSSKPPAEQQLVFYLVTQTDIKDGGKQEHKAEIWATESMKRPWLGGKRRNPGSLISSPLERKYTTMNVLK